MNAKRNILVFIGSGLLIAATRVIPHADNFTPMESLVLFGTLLYSSRVLAFVLPLVLMYGFDFVINNTLARSYFPEQEGLIFFSNYMVFNALAYIFIALAGIFLLKRLKITNVLAGSVLSAVLFYAITNFGAWIGSAMYPQTSTGLWMSYLAGLPFLKSTLVSTLFFSAVFYTFIKLYERLISKSLVFDHSEQ